LRWSGGILIVAASLWAIHSPRPDVLVSSDGSVLAVRGSDGRLSIHRTGRDTFAIKEWLAADGDARLPGDETLPKGFRCDESACMASLPDGKLVSQVIESDAFEEDCARATVVVTTRDWPDACKATVIDRRLSRERGAVALRRVGESYDLTAARPPGQERPWARGSAVPTEPARPATRPSVRDATPRPADLEAGD
jgi:competence protein ComEC